MVAYKYFNVFVGMLGRGQHNLDAGGDVVKVVIGTEAPVATDTNYTTSNTPGANEFTDLNTANGYTEGGEDITNTWTQRTGANDHIWQMGASDVAWTATGALTFRYVSIYNSDNATPGDSYDNGAIGYWDNGGNITLASTNTFTVDFATTGVFTIAGSAT